MDIPRPGARRAAAKDPAPRGVAATRSIREVTPREMAILLVLQLAQEPTETFSPMGFYDDDTEFMSDLALALNVPYDAAFKNKVVKVCRHLVRYGVLHAKIRQTAKEYIDEPNRQQNYTLRPGKGHLLREECRPGITYGPRGRGGVASASRLSSRLTRAGAPRRPALRQPQGKNAMQRLTEAQKRVLKWIGHGWRTEPGSGSAVMVNGRRICNTDTMMALYRAGLARQDDQGCWSATASGKTITAELGL